MVIRRRVTLITALIVPIIPTYSLRRMVIPEGSRVKITNLDVVSVGKPIVEKDNTLAPNIWDTDQHLRWIIKRVNNSLIDSICGTSLYILDSGIINSKIVKKGRYYRDAIQSKCGVNLGGDKRYLREFIATQEKL